ncbi:MAG: hypothetical protein [Mu-like cryoconite phage AB09]|nr:MAG: hypothetical protein [Mu-like cryoconite phage AB09]
MSCENEGFITVIQGEDRDIFLRVVDKASEQPFDLTNASAINARFKNADGTVLIKSLTDTVLVVSGPAGKIKVGLSLVDTALLKAKENQDFEIEITVGTGASARKTVVQFLKAMTVKSRVV